MDKRSWKGQSCEWSLQRQQLYDRSQLPMEQEINPCPNGIGRRANTCDRRNEDSLSL